MRIYPHIIVDHGKRIFERHGPLSALSQQGMEHANKRDVLTWHRHTGKGGGCVKVTLPLIAFTYPSFLEGQSRQQQKESTKGTKLKGITFITLHAARFTLTNNITIFVL